MTHYTVHYIRLKINLLNFLKVMLIRKTLIEAYAKSTLTIVKEDEVRSMFQGCG